MGNSLKPLFTYYAQQEKAGLASLGRRPEPALGGASVREQAQVAVITEEEAASASLHTHVHHL